MKTGHVALITLHADPATPSGVGEGGGSHAYVRELMIGLHRSGWALTVLTRWADPTLPENESVASTLRIIRLRIGEVGSLDKRLLNNLHTDSLAAAQAALEQRPPADVLHSVYWNSGRVAMDLGAHLGIPFVHTVISSGWRRMKHGAFDQPADRLTIERQVFAAAFAIFCISAEERADLLEHYAVDPGRVVVVGRPVARSFRHPCRDERGNPPRPHWPEAD